MNKYLLVAGDCYYPQSGTGDWIACFETEAEAKAVVTEVLKEPAVFLSGPRKGQVKPEDPHTQPWDKISHYEINGSKYDWYDIIDLEVWMNTTYEHNNSTR